METLTLTAPDISCEHCQHTIQQEVGALDGVQSVMVDVPTKRVNVSYDPTRTTREQIVLKLDEEGYPIAE